MRARNTPGGRSERRRRAGAWRAASRALRGSQSPPPTRRTGAHSQPSHRSRPGWFARVARVDSELVLGKLRASGASVHGGGSRRSGTSGAPEGAAITVPCAQLARLRNIRLVAGRRMVTSHFSRGSRTWSSASDTGMSPSSPPSQGGAKATAPWPAVHCSAEPTHLVHALRAAGFGRGAATRRSALRSTWWNGSGRPEICRTVSCS
jgi:hypothetical protein